jgi:hypothetical protein
MIEGVQAVTMTAMEDISSGLSQPATNHAGVQSRRPGLDRRVPGHSLLPANEQGVILDPIPEVPW